MCEFSVKLQSYTSGEQVFFILRSTGSCSFTGFFSGKVIKEGKLCVSRLSLCWLGTSTGNINAAFK